MAELLQTTLCYLERDGQYLMLHRVKKEKDVNKDKWIGPWPPERMHLFTCRDFSGVLCACEEGDLEWVDKTRVEELPIWAGDRIFFRLLNEGAPFFHLELTYDGDRLQQAVLDGKRL